MSDLLRNAVLLDTETFGLGRGDVMHELAFYNMESRDLHAYSLLPERINVRNPTPQELTKLAGYKGDIFELIKYNTYQQALHAYAEQLAGANVPHGQTHATLAKYAAWLEEHLSMYPHLVNQQDDIVARTLLLKQFNAKLIMHENASMEIALAELHAATQGKTIWIANAAFESKQIGAHLGARGAKIWDAFKSNLETRNPSSPDPYYVTGTEVTRERVIAQASGDWTRVWKAYNKYIPKVGESAVRDIQDITRAIHSYGYKLGLTSKNLNYLATGIDISHRLHAYAENDLSRMNIKEFHRAAEDVAIHEEYVLRRNIKIAEALENVYEGTDLGKLYQQQAAAGGGPLVEAARYFEILEAHRDIEEKAQTIKRLDRALTDIETQGATYQTVGQSPVLQDQLGPDGSDRPIYKQEIYRKRYESLDDVIEHLKTENKTNANYKIIAEELRQAPEPHVWANEEIKRLSSTWDDIVVPSSVSKLRKLINYSTKPTIALDVVNGVLENVRGKSGALGIAGASIFALGVGASYFQKPLDKPANLLDYSYDEWIAHQAIDGLPEGPVNQSHRQYMTDFGSPYRGMVGVQQVFIEQDMLRERDKWIHQQYGARFAAHKFPTIASLNPFFAKSLKIEGGYNFIHGGHAVQGKDYGMRGNLRAINLSEEGWKISVEDADTITIKRGGLSGALKSFFGLNQGHSFRLAGLDSPEVAHEDRPAQPWAEEAKIALSNMMKNSKDVTVIFDPAQMTYGRMMGGIYADGRNINLELVQRGFAAHLPFGKAQDAIIDYNMLKQAEVRAFQGNRGIWSQPWERFFYKHSEASGNRPTFNSLAKTQTIVENKGTMMMVSAMEQVQASGQFTIADELLATELGSQYNIGADPIGPHIMIAATASSTSYLQEQLQDLAEFTKTHGSGRQQNKFSARSGYGKLDGSLALDTIGTSNNIWTRRNIAAFDQYHSKKRLAHARKERMAYQQREILRKMNESPIGHYRM